MEPQIQYAKTEDGVSIAFWTLGEGVPLVLMPFSSFTHAQLNWRIPETRRSYELMGEKAMLIHYDGRGTGLSDREVTDYSLDARMLDLEAVLERLNLERVALYGNFHSGPVAIAFAARHPERVSHLVLWQTWAQASDYYGLPQIQGLLSLQEMEWNMFLETTAHSAFGWSEGDFSHRAAQFMRECVTQDASQAFESAAREFDTTPLLAQVECPTLVMHVREAPYPPVDVARRLASRIPNARLALFEGEEVALLRGQEAVAQATGDFLREGEEPAQEPALPEGTAIILFVDIAESTALTERLGDAAFRAKAGKLDASLRATVRDAGGTPVEGKVLGDGVMAVFTSARGAIDCALRCRVVGEDAGLPLHLGIHAGDVLREGATVYGGAVNLAQRITDASAPGEILVSDTLRGLARTSTDVSFEDRGEREMKGIEEPQRLWAVREQG